MDYRLSNFLQIRIWARKKAIEEKHGDYALNITGPILQFYERYYNTAYPLSKSGGHLRFHVMQFTPCSENQILVWECGLKTN